MVGYAYYKVIEFFYFPKKIYILFKKRVKERHSI